MAGYEPIIGLTNASGNRSTIEINYIDRPFVTLWVENPGGSAAKGDGAEEYLKNLGTYLNGHANFTFRKMMIAVPGEDVSPEQFAPYDIDNYKAGDSNAYFYSEVMEKLVEAGWKGEFYFIINTYWVDMSSYGSDNKVTREVVTESLTKSFTFVKNVNDAIEGKGLPKIAGVCVDTEFVHNYPTESDITIDWIMGQILSLPFTGATDVGCKVAVSAGAESFNKSMTQWLTGTGTYDEGTQFANPLDEVYIQFYNISNGESGSDAKYDACTLRVESECGTDEGSKSYSIYNKFKNDVTGVFTGEDGIKDIMTSGSGNNSWSSSSYDVYTADIAKKVFFLLSGTNGSNYGSGAVGACIQPSSISNPKKTSCGQIISYGVWDVEKFGDLLLQFKELMSANINTVFDNMPEGANSTIGLFQYNYFPSGWTNV